MKIGKKRKKGPAKAAQGQQSASDQESAQVGESDKPIKDNKELEEGSEEGSESSEDSKQQIKDAFWKDFLSACNSSYGDRFCKELNLLSPKKVLST